MTTRPALPTALAPTGTLRAAINIGNPLLARQDPGTQEVHGISIDLAQALAGQLGLPLTLQVFKTAGESVRAVGDGQADLGFFAIDPVRGEKIAFTAPYALIEGYYLVREDSPIRRNPQVDQAGNRVVVGQGSAYDLFLTRHLQAAQIIRAPSSQAVVSTFLSQGWEVAAGVRQQLEADTQSLTGLRLLDERFMVIQQAMGVAKARGNAAADFLDDFVARMKASGAIAQSLARHRVTGVSAAV
ncbi:ABC transporter substrate-binding protein [Castellaniella hirudinis]|uniref:ABC transporter substrate-binding protein n=1 Tax=Castellaniella hirudinis TaxID=1144617 RepID=UPI0039C12B43